jgi:beta-galactosidase
MSIAGLFAVIGLLAAAAVCSAASDPQFVTDVFSHNYGYRQKIDLAGTWQIHRDKDNQGKDLGWQDGNGDFASSIRIPGCPQAQGIGEPSDCQKNLLNEPFWVRRTFAMPPVPAGKRVWLRIGGILPAAEIYINGKYIGYTQSSRTRQRVDVTDALKPNDNLIAIKVCDWPKVKLEGIWEMAEIQRVWTGVYGPISLEITDPACISDIYVRPCLASKSVRVDFELTKPMDTPAQVRMQAQDGSRIIGSAVLDMPAGQRCGSGEISLDGFQTWSPDHPKLYELCASVGDRDKVSVRFGMREIESIGTKFYLNGKPVYLRAYGDDQLYPYTICPPAGKDAYLPMLRRAREFGLNAAKSCEETFNQDYIEAADEAGIMIIQEMPFGLSGEVRVHQHELDKPWRDYYTQELDGLVVQSRNNPSVIAFSMCSEVPLDGGTQEAFDLFLRDLPKRAKQLAPHAMVVDNTGMNGGEVRKKGVRVTDFYAVVNPLWCKEALNEAPVKADGKHPIMMHEYNWWSCYPDPKSRTKYDNTPLKPWWLDVLEKSAKENGQSDLIPTYVRNSGWLQNLCRKDGLEYARRCPNVEGYILWLITDYGQYTEGIFDDFWQPKANASAKDLLQSTADTVIVLAKEGNRCLAMGKEHSIPLAVSHYGEVELTDCVVKWTAKGGPVNQHGEIPVRFLKQGELTQIGDVALHLPAAAKGYKLDLQVSLQHDGREVNSNSWSFWAMPESTAITDPGCLTGGAFWRIGSSSTANIPDGVSLVVADFADQALADYVSNGGSCLLLANGAACEEPENVYQGYTTFRTIPWNGGPGNLGTVISDHPALAEFPHGKACDFQFTWLISRAHPMNLDTPLLRDTLSRREVIIRDIDWYRLNKNLAYMIEFNVGKGRVLVTSLRIVPTLRERLESRYLLKCLLDYVGGSGFSPSAYLPADVFVKSFSKASEKPK